MSLFGLPVSANDLIQLQEGLTLASNMNAAQTEAATINAGKDTVYNYANTLLANQGDTDVDLTGVAMAVSALMEGGTIPVGDANTSNTLTLLSTVFLPPQVANAIKFGYPATVYAAEAVGLALSTLPGFQSLVNLDIDQFSQAVSTTTGIHGGAIKQWVTNWEAFYTANPQNGTTVTQAAYGAAFGDAVGVALANPTADGTIALLVSEVQNVLFDNAEGGYQVGIPLSAEPPHIPLQGEALLIPGANGTIDLNPPPFFNYAEFTAPAQTGALTIKDAPSIFTLNTQHFGNNNIEIDAANGSGLLCTIIIGDNTSTESLREVATHGYSTVDIDVVNGSGLNGMDGLIVAGNAGTPGDLVVSGNGQLLINGLSARSITDNGVILDLTGFLEVSGTIDASHAQFFGMLVPDTPPSTVGGVTVLGGAAHDLLQGSVGSKAELVKFSNGSIGLSPDFAGADNITSNASGGDDAIFGDGGADNITLAANHSGSDTVVFGAEFDGAPSVLAITDGTDSAYLGYWSAPGATPIPQLFPSNTGGTSADMTTVTGFNAGSSASHDVLEFDVAGWNGASTSLGFAVQGDLVTLSGLLVVPTGAAQLSAVWVNSSSNGSLKTTDDVLLYAPSDASLQNAQQLAAQLHTAADGVVMPGLIPPGADVHILVAYPAGNNAVNIADVDLVNTGTTPQTSTANFFVHVYASDMVHLTGLALTDLTSANIHFFTNTLT